MSEQNYKQKNSAIEFHDTVLIMEDEEEIEVCPKCEAVVNKHNEGKCPIEIINVNEKRSKKLHFKEAFHEKYHRVIFKTS